MTLLLHACCGPCLGGSWAGLKKADPELQATLLWDNPNIHPYLEYRERHNGFLTMAKALGIPIAGNDPQYGLEGFLQALGQDSGGLPEGSPLGSVAGNPRTGHPKRCRKCFELRLAAAARKAKDLGCEAFTTTLLISPYQDHELLVQTGRETSQRHGVPFHYVDLRPHFRETYEAARAHGLYRQKYCGCLFSEQERFSGDARFALSPNPSPAPDRPGTAPDGPPPPAPAAK